MTLLDLPESTWEHTTRGRIKRGDSVKVIWNAGPMRFVAAGVVEEKPHCIDDPENERIHMKFSARCQELRLVDSTGYQISANDAGFLWGNWLFVPKSAEFWCTPSM